MTMRSKNRRNRLYGPGRGVVRCAVESFPCIRNCGCDRGRNYNAHSLMGFSETLSGGTQSRMALPFQRSGCFAFASS